MEKKGNIEDIAARHSGQDKTLEGRAADLGELIIEREREEGIFGRDTQKIAELEKMITLQKKLVLRMINGDEKEFLLHLPKKPHLKIVK